jgi:fused signal recognition particle receptor
MVFNWFRRKSSNSSATPQEAESTPTSVESDAEPSGETSSEEPSQDVVAARLDWAKAAYKNIQQQQSQQIQEVSDNTLAPALEQGAEEQRSRGAEEQGSRGEKVLLLNLKQLLTNRK